QPAVRFQAFWRRRGAAEEWVDLEAESAVEALAWGRARAPFVEIRIVTGPRDLVSFSAGDGVGGEPLWPGDRGDWERPVPWPGPLEAAGPVEGFGGLVG